MEIEKTEQQGRDTFVLLDDFLHQAKRMWLLGLALILICAAGLTFVQRRAYRPVYEASASFTVRVANPLYASVSSYNEKTAQVMADTFPSILTSGLLQRRVMDELGIDEVPAMSVSATAQSSILTLKVRDTDPQRAYDVMSAVIACYPEVAEFVVGSTVLVLLDESGMPTAPVAEFNYRYYITRGAVVGAAVWCVILAFLVLMKNTVHNEDELRKTLNAPCLGQIPAVKVSRKRPYPLLHRYRSESGFSESVRLLRLRVEKAMQENGQKILLVSSAIPGEGKTTVSVNLAVSLAQKGRWVLLIDCDFRNPSVAKTLSSRSHPLDEGRNLTNFTGSGEAAGALAQATDVEGLFVIVGNADGKADYFDAPTQARLTKLIRYARDKYDYVILDTPPCSLLTDAAEAAEAAEAGLMVIRQDYASRDQILDGAQRLSDSRLPIIGCALNNVRESLSGSKEYGYGYCYGYGYGYGYGSKSRQEKK